MPSSSTIPIFSFAYDRHCSNSHLIKIHNKYNAFDIMQLQNDLNNAKNDIKNRDGEILKLKFDVELAKNKMLKALRQMMILSRRSKN